MPELTELRAFHLRSIRCLWTNAEDMFKGFRKDCPSREGTGCNNKDYHRDFELANICKLVDCPIVQGED